MTRIRRFRDNAEHRGARREALGPLSWISCFEIPTLEAGLTVALKFLETSLLTSARPPKFSYPQFGKSRAYGSSIGGGGPSASLILLDTSSAYFLNYPFSGKIPRRNLFFPNSRFSRFPIFSIFLFFAAGGLMCECGRRRLYRTILERTSNKGRGESKTPRINSRRNFGC